MIEKAKNFQTNLLVFEYYIFACDIHLFCELALQTSILFLTFGGFNTFINDESIV